MSSINKPLAQPQRLSPVLSADKITFSNYWFQWLVDLIKKVNAVLAVATGQATLVAGTVDVPITGLTADDSAAVTLVLGAGTLGVAYQGVCTDGVLTITALNADLTTAAGDVSTVNYVIYSTT